jgi:hypothetical protein
VINPLIPWSNGVNMCNTPPCITIPLVKCAKSFDAFMDGNFSKEYRRRLESLCCKRQVCLLKKLECRVYIDFGVASLNISCEEFKRAVHRTILEKDKIRVSDLPEEDKRKMDEVIVSIYSAVQKCNGSVFDLFIFTSIAMFNHHSFTKFPHPNTDNEENRCRGLLQIKSEKYYKMLRKNSHRHDYVKQRYLLDSLTSSTIKDEFLLYKSVFAYKSGSRDICLMMSRVIINMASLEGQVLERKAYMDIEKIHDEELRTKLRNRFSILNYLLFYADYDEIITSSRSGSDE